jgi:cyclic pyranopterin phosphate synthase
MVDVSGKPVTSRRAVARGRVGFGAAAFAALKANRLAKGDALAVARLAGIQAAKRTSEWIPLCHTVALDSLDVEIALVPRGRRAIKTRRATQAARGRWKRYRGAAAAWPSTTWPKPSTAASSSKTSC